MDSKQAQQKHDALREQLVQSSVRSSINRVQVYSRDSWWANLIGTLRPSISTPQAVAAFQRFNDRTQFHTHAGGMYFDASYLERSNSQSSMDSDPNSPFSRSYRYYDYNNMDEWPELNSALDIYADEVNQSNEDGEIIHVECSDASLKAEIESLIVKLSLESRMWFWTRDMCKYGDKFVVLKIKRGEGVIDVIDETIPETFDRIEADVPVEEFNEAVHNIPAAASTTITIFNWRTRRNSGKTTGFGTTASSQNDKVKLTELDVLHFRIKKKGVYLPYGTSELDAARHHWRRLTHMEDAVFIYRIIRAPERKAFYVDTGNLDVAKSREFIERLKGDLRSKPILSESGEINRRSATLTVEQDYWIPMKNGKKAVEIDTVPGGQFLNDIDDINYIQAKLFAATKVPKAFLSYEEQINAKATLSNQDIRFGRTVQRIQEIVLEQLYKLVMIHLYYKSFPVSDASFKLSMTPSSLIVRMQNLEMLNSRFDVASNAGEIVPRKWIWKEIMHFTDKQIEDIERYEQEEQDKRGKKVGGKGGGGRMGGSLFDDFGGGGGSAGPDLDLGGPTPALGTPTSATTAAPPPAPAPDLAEEDIIGVEV